MQLRRRLAALTLAAALCCPVLSSCSAGGSSPGLPAALGPLESQRMSPKQHAILVSGLQSKIKYVFVLFEENHSFDSVFGTYPGAENLASPMAKAHGFSQYDPAGKRSQTVFKTTLPDVLAPDQDRPVLEKKLNGFKMNRFVAEEEIVDESYRVSAAQARQFGLTTMASIDCDTVPYTWMYAHNFSLLDHYFQLFEGPSTPGNVSMIAAQTGISEQRHFPELTSNPATLKGVPLIGDLDPAYGPGTNGSGNQIPQSYATMPMLFGGSAAAAAATVKGKVSEDLQAIAAMNLPAIGWAWDQEGYVNSTTVKTGFVAHRHAPQYFDYLRNNDVYWSHVGSAKGALSRITTGKLQPGVYYIKGSGDNEFGWKPANKDPYVQQSYLGDDDHPGSSDSYISEAFLATYVNAIAQSPYWNESAILITWDDDGGYYDHVPPQTFEKCPDGNPCGNGPRLPLLVISPYAQSGSVTHDYSDTSSIAKFIETVFGLPALGTLPDEKSVEPYGPGDVNPAVSDLAGAFDPAKLSGSIAPIPASMAEIPASEVGKFPPTMNCHSLGITPVKIPRQPSYYKPIPASNAAARELERVERERGNTND